MESVLYIWNGLSWVDGGLFSLWGGRGCGAVLIFRPRSAGSQGTTPARSRFRLAHLDPMPARPGRCTGKIEPSHREGLAITPP